MPTPDLSLLRQRQIAWSRRTFLGKSAQAIGTLGESGAAAVPGLVRLLTSGVEGDRVSACAALASIGPAASGGLPSLRAAVSDQSAVVSGCARGAISKIER